ncbi:MAG: hypothetical protein KF775_12920 [Cyclobacteriaceae bacterium]|nr:hypothetical protein [Cyclobacteriaceae bacterium]
MQTITIDILNEKALELIKKLEEMNLVKVTKETTVSKSRKKPSDYKGILSDKSGSELLESIKKSRNEWD